MDCIIVDGPQAWNRDLELSRYMTVPILSERLKNDYSIFLDDGLRLGERKVRRKWEKELDIKI